MAFLYALPPFVFLALALTVVVGLACAGQWYVHARFREREFVPSNDVAGFIIAVVGTLYAVVLGFITVIVWQHYDETRLLAARESASVGDVWHDTVGLPPMLRTHVRGDLLAYAQTMIDDEWPRMREGGASPRGDVLLMDATSDVGMLVPANAMESNAQAAIVHLLNDVHDDRSARHAANEAAVSPFQWTILLLGAMVVIGFCYLFRVAHPRAHYLMTAAVATVIASMFVLIFELQYPFRTELGVSAASWRALVVHIHAMDRMGGPMSTITLTPAR